MNSEVCVDASVVLKWYLPEEWDQQADALRDECVLHGIRMVAPDAVFAEVGSVLRNAVHRGIRDPDAGRFALMLLKKAEIETVDVRELYENAWRIAETYNLPTLYDAYYLALAELRGCDFWTADERLVDSAPDLAYVKHIRDFAPGALSG